MSAGGCCLTCSRGQEGGAGIAAHCLVSCASIQVCICSYRNLATNCLHHQTRGQTGTLEPSLCHALIILMACRWTDATGTPHILVSSVALLTPSAAAKGNPWWRGTIGASDPDYWTGKWGNIRTSDLQQQNSRGITPAVSGGHTKGSVTQHASTASAQAGTDDSEDSTSPAGGPGSTPGGKYMAWGRLAALGVKVLSVSQPGEAPVELTVSEAYGNTSRATSDDQSEAQGGWNTGSEPNENGDGAQSKQQRRRGLAQGHSSGPRRSVTGGVTTGAGSVTISRREDLAVKTGIKVLVLRPQYPAGCGAGTEGGCDAAVGHWVWWVGDWVCVHSNICN
jgi:hypothetical protein